MKRKNCYIYTRVSTSMQVDGFSLDAQREKLRRYAEFQDFMIAGEYSDEGKSGKNIEGRPEFQTMLNDISEGKDNVEYVLVFKLSRFGRNAADVLNSLQLMQDCGHMIIPNEDGKTVTISGCTQGVDWTVLHEGENVKIILEDGAKIIVPLEMYKNEVFKFTDEIEAFYNASTPKKLSENEEDWERKAYLLFWDEWHRRRK